MTRVIVLIGLDCDRPRSTYSSQPNYVPELDLVCDYLQRLGRRWSALGVSWTHFLCGEFIDSVALHVGTSSQLRDVLGVSIGRCEVACHTYDHRPMAEVPGRPQLVPQSVDESLSSVDRNTELLNQTFGIVPIGTRAPYGHVKGALPNPLVAGLALRRLYVSSWLRTQAHGICPPLVDGGLIRQPYRYADGLWEIPTHGWHDTAFAGLSPTLGGRQVLGAFDHYVSLIDEARVVSAKQNEAIYVGLALHPIAMARYDPNLRLLDYILQKVDVVDILSYGQAAGKVNRAAS